MPLLPPTPLTDGRIVVRRYHGGDAQALRDAIAASLSHLRRWMPWAAHEPLPVEVKAALIAEWTKQWDAGEDFVYVITTADDDTTIIGGSGLHRRIGSGGLEIGYWVRADRIRQGVATSATRLLTAAALSLDGIDRVEIHHDRANVASAAVPRRLGYRFVEEREDERTAPGDEGVEWVWRMDHATWAAVDAEDLVLDVIGNEKRDL